MESNASLASIQSSLITPIKHASIVQINKSMMLKSKNVFPVLMIFLYFQVMSVLNVPLTLITTKPLWNANLALREEFTVKISSNVYVLLIESIGLELSVFHAIFPDTSMLNLKNALCVQITRFMMLI